MPALTADSLLACWEHGRSRHPLDRALLLYAIAAPETDPGTLADQSLGQRNAALLRLRQAMFGDALSCCVDCPHCEERHEFELRVSTLLEQQREPIDRVEMDGLRFRVPTTRDLARVAHETEPAATAHKLLLALAEPGRPLKADEVERLINPLAEALEDADPCIDFALDFSCSACGQSWTSSFDIAAHLWDEVDARSRRLLDEIHVLARVYGWTEREVLRLSDMRRQSYIERALA
jgi:hypothetical protein